MWSTLIKDFIKHIQMSLTQKKKKRPENSDREFQMKILFYYPQEVSLLNGFKVLLIPDQKTVLALILLMSFQLI